MSPKYKDPQYSMFHEHLYKTKFWMSEGFTERIFQTVQSTTTVTNELSYEECILIGILILWVH